MAAGPAVRAWSVRLHRWAALLLGLWFAVAGLTGTVLVWHAELDRALNPDWFAPRAGCDHREPATPVATSLAVYARHRAEPATQVMRPELPDAAYVVWSKPGERRMQHFVDPRCGAYLGGREWGAPRIDRAHVVPALYELHRALLGGEAGHVVVGIGGAWLLGIALTGVLNAWPRRASKEAWRRALSVRRDAGRPRLFYDLHRAVGLWLAPFLMLMSLTGLYLCFPKPAKALVAAMLPVRPESGASTAPAGVVLGPDAMVRAAESLWPSASWTRVQVPQSSTEPVEVRLLQADELRRDTGDTRAKLRADGSVLDRRDPLRDPAGDRLLSLMFPLHSGEALGVPGRLLWTFSGTAPLVLFLTGTWLWVRRRQRHEGARS